MLVLQAWRRIKSLVRGHSTPPFASRCTVFFFFRFENKNFNFFISTIIYCVIFRINITLGTASFILLYLPLGFPKTILSQNKYNPWHCFFYFTLFTIRIPKNNSLSSNSFFQYFFWFWLFFFYFAFLSYYRF